MSGWLNDKVTSNSWAIALGSPSADLVTYKYGTSSAKFIGNGGIYMHCDTSFRLNSTWTIEFWFRASGASAMLMKTSNLEAGYSYLQIEIGSNGVLNLQGTSFSDKNYMDGNWHHLAWVTGNIYIDGSWKRYHRPEPVCGNGAYIHLGQNNNNTAPLTGNIDDFRMTNTQVYTGTGSYTMPTSGLTQIPGTVTLMNFNETLYQIAGTLSDDAKIFVIDESSENVEYSDVKTAGAYSIIVSDASEKTVVAIRESDGKLLGYGRVIPNTL